LPLELGKLTFQGLPLGFRQERWRVGFLVIEGLDGFFELFGLGFRDYENEDRPLRCSEPRDLIHRCLDISRYLNQPMGLSRDLLELAWINYFGIEKTANN
jgi:hypothetical protein